MRLAGTRWWPSTLATILSLSIVLSGCLDASDGDDNQEGADGRVEGTPLVSLSTHDYRYLGDDVMHADHPYGWMLNVRNLEREAVTLRVDVLDNATVWGPVDQNGWNRSADAAVELTARSSVLYLFQRPGTAFVDSLEYGVHVLDSNDRVVQSGWMQRNFSQPLAGAAVEANHHVTTRTVGVWVNGTSFYTNIRELNQDPEFPAGYDREAFGGSDLRVYVYDQDRSEQPAGSQDRCFFTTIPGYNDLLKTQGEGTSNVRFLRPEEAYTRDGAEDHFLYGDALVFMNTVVAVVGDVDELQGSPQPTGDCFDATRGVPQLPLR